VIYSIADGSVIQLAYDRHDTPEEETRAYDTATGISWAGTEARGADLIQREIFNVGWPFIILGDDVETISYQLSTSSMHLAKGLEFKAIVVMACDDEVIPLQQRIESVANDPDLQEIYETERRLLYVACTRARDHLLMTSVAPSSEFLDDLKDERHPLR
jgi:superfamily I DNA/RNA helicase